MTQQDTDGAGARSGRWWEPLAGGMGYGLLTCLAFPPVDWWPVALVAIAPLAWAACRGAASPRRLWRAALLVSLGVLPTWLFEERWLIDVTVLGYPLMAVYMSVYAGLFVWLVGAVRRAAPAVPMCVAVPVIWTGVEVLRGEVALTGYAWFLAGHPLIAVPSLAAPAAITGAYGVSMLLAALAGAGADVAGWSNGGQRVGLVGAVAVSAGWVGLARMGSPGDAGPVRSVRFAVVQTNVPQSNKVGWTIERRLSDFARFLELTREAAVGRVRPEVIVWPETMFPGEGLNTEAVEAQRRMALVWGPGEAGVKEIPMTAFADELLDFQQSLGVPMLVGALAEEGLRAEKGEGRSVKLVYHARYNSAMVVAGGRVRDQRYDKVALTPFGEVIPYVWRLPALQDAVLSVGAAGMAFDLSAGKEATVVEVPLAVGGGVRCATPICFEGTKAWLCRDMVYANGRRRADVLVNLSNDGWFSRWRGGREQHLQAARWRCVELGVPMVRAVNTGVSALIDSRGRLLASGPDGRNQSIDVDGVMAVDVPIGGGDRGTVYGRIGELVGWLSLGGTGMLAGLAVVRRPRGAGGRR